MRRISVLLNAGAHDPEYQAWLGAFLQGLELLGWNSGRNVQIDTRWATADAAEIRRHAAELAALAPDVILASGGSTVAPLLQATRTCLSCSRSPPIPLPPASSKAWRALAATPLGS